MRRILGLGFLLTLVSLTALWPWPLGGQDAGSISSRLKAPAANISYLVGSASLSWSAIPANSCVDAASTITVTGAADGDTVILGVLNSQSSTAGVTFRGYVSAANTVKVRACNVATSASGAISAATVKVGVFH